VPELKDFQTRLLQRNPFGHRKELAGSENITKIRSYQNGV